jgi:predicted TIM-barrel fold metal-dependent hydrolase
MTGHDSTGDASTGNVSTGIVDVHAHLLSAEALSARAQWAQPAGGPVEVVDQLQRMDAVGVERAFLVAARIGQRGLPGSWELAPEVVARVVASHPDRFSGLYGINPFDGVKGVAELDRFVTDHGFVGAQVYPHWFGKAPDDASYYPFYAKCWQLGVPVQVHVGTVALRTPEQRLVSVSRPNGLDGVACDMPDLSIVATHGAWPWADEMVSVADKHGNVTVVLNRRPPMGWGPAITRYARSWGKHKVMFAGDTTHRTYSDALTEIDELLGTDASGQGRSMFTEGNARQVYL